MSASLALGVLAVAFALCRFGLESLSRAKLLQTVTDPRGRDRYERYFEHIDRTKVAMMTLSVAAEALLVVSVLRTLTLLTDGRATAGVVAATVVASVLFVLLFCRILPRLIVVRGFETPARRLLPAFHGFGLLLLPVTAPLLALRRGLSRALGLGDREKAETAFNDEIIATIAEGERDGVVAEEQAEMIENVVEFKDVDVAEVMTPRTDMVWVEASKSVHGALEVAAENGHSRIPVCDGDADHVIGVFYVRDVLARLSENNDLKQIPVRDLCRKAYFVPESKKVGSLLSEFRENQVHIAIVLDEYGGTAGLVTLEDVVEEIVGEIVDEYDEPEGEPELTVIDHDHAKVDARAHIWEVNEALEVELPESEDFDTVGGFVFSTLGRVPHAGETITHDNVEIKVLEADERRIKQLEVRVLSRTEERE